MYFENPFNPKLSVEKNYVFEKSSVMMREIMGGSKLPNPPFSHFSRENAHHGLGSSAWFARH